MIIIVCIILYNLYIILMGCNSLRGRKAGLEYFSNRSSCTSGQGPNGQDGYQCTLGCGGGSGDMRRYPWKTREKAAEACRSRGFKGLCSRAEIEKTGRINKLDMCCTGWTSDDQVGWWNTERQSGCGGGGGGNWNSWTPGTAAAHCCGESPVANDLRKAKKTVNILQTKLAKNQSDLHMLDYKGASSELERQAMRKKQQDTNAALLAAELGRQTWQDSVTAKETELSMMRRQSEAAAASWKAALADLRKSKDADALKVLNKHKLDIDLAAGGSAKIIRASLEFASAQNEQIKELEEIKGEYETTLDRQSIAARVCADGTVEAPFASPNPEPMARTRKALASAMGNVSHTIRDTFATPGINHEMLLTSE